MPPEKTYRLLCFSLYHEDVALLEKLVAELRKRGVTRANKSMVVRAALAQLDVTKVPRNG